MTTTAITWETLTDSQVRRLTLDEIRHLWRTRRRSYPSVTAEQFLAVVYHCQGMPPEVESYYDETKTHNNAAAVLIGRMQRGNSRGLANAAWAKARKAMAK